MDVNTLNNMLQEHARARDEAYKAKMRIDTFVHEHLDELLRTHASTITVRRNSRALSIGLQFTIREQ